MSIVKAAALLTSIFLIQASSAPPSASATKANRVFTDLPFIAAHPGLVTRSGRTLTFRNGETLTDEGECDEGDCFEWRVDGVWHDRFVGVSETQYEHAGYVIVNLGVNNSLVSTASRPIPSPNGKLFFAGEHDDRAWDPLHGAAIWAFDEYGPNRLRLVDTHLLMFDRFVAWRGDKCVEFTGARGYNRDPKPIRTYWLAEEAGDWRLLETPSDVCEVSRSSSPAAAPARDRNRRGTR